jgi:hypothetical protein
MIFTLFSLLKGFMPFSLEIDQALIAAVLTIIGYSVAASGAKTLRKPETVKDYVAMTKRTFATAFKALKTKEAAVNGRINEDCVILKVL